MATDYAMVRVKNVGDKPFRDSFANQPFEVLPNKETFVPFDAAALWFGHPELYDVSPRQRARTQMYARLRQRYGAFDDTNRDDKVTSADEKWEQNRPRIEVYSLDGERIYMVIDDPDGTRETTVTPDASESQSILLRLHRLEREGQMLREALASKEKDEGGTDSTGTDRADGVDSTDSTDNKNATNDTTPVPASPPSPTSTRKTPSTNPLIPAPRLLDGPDAEKDEPKRPGVKNP